MQSTGAMLLLSQALMALAGILAARAVGPEGKGVITAVTTWAQLLMLLSLAGVANATNVRVASDVRSTPVALGNALIYALGVGGIAALGGLLFLPEALDRLGSDAQAAAVLALVTLPAGILTECMLGVILAHGRNRAYQLCRLAGPIVLLCITLALWGLGELTPFTAVAAIAAGWVVSAAAAALAVPWDGLSADLRKLRQDIGFGLKIYVGSLLNLANFRLDLLLMSLLLPAAQIGFYGVANNVVAPVMTLASSAAILLTSAVARSNGQEAREGLTREQLALVAATARRYTLLTVAGGLLLVPAGPFLIPFVFGASFEPSVELVWILIPGYVALSYASIVGAGAIGARRPWILNASEAAGLILTITLLPLLLPRYEAVGAAITSSVAYTVSALVAAFGLRYLAGRAVTTDDALSSEPSGAPRLSSRMKGVAST